MGAKVVAGLFKRGVIARAMRQGDTLGFAPPLCLSTDEADNFDVVLPPKLICLILAYD